MLKTESRATNRIWDDGTTDRQDHAERIQVHQGLEDFPLRSLNILIGANGAGKSNFVSFFTFLREAVEGRLGLYVAKKGGADDHLFMGPK